MSLFAPIKTTARTSSPTWSVYDDQWGDNDECALAEEAAQAGSPAQQLQPQPNIPYISYPPFQTTLKGSQVKKKAPIRRGAQGAVYAAFDAAVTAPSVAAAVHVDVAQRETSPLPFHKPLSSGEKEMVAVKRIFVQSNDFGSRDISATVLREVTLHRLVCARQECYCACGANATSSSSKDDGGSAGAAGGSGAGAACLLDDSARVLRLRRVVEAPHKEMCLVLELAATNLERLTAEAAAGHGAGLGGRKKKPGTVTLFSRPTADEDDSGHQISDLRVRSSLLSGGKPPAVTSPSMSKDTTNGQRALLSQLPLVRYVMRRLLRLVCFLHEECHVVHRDLKPSNILVTHDGGLRLGDFGSARFILPSSTFAQPAAASAAAPGVESSSKVSSLECTPPSMRTTLHYRPPEALFGDQACRPAADVWALGVMFAQLLLQKNLFHAESELDLLGAIQKLLGMPTASPSWLSSNVTTTDGEGNHAGQVGVAKLSLHQPPFTVAATAVQASLPHKLHPGIVPAEGLDLVTRMLQQLPEHRLSIREAMAHPFLSPPADSAEEQRRRVETDDAAGAALWKETVAAVLGREASGSASAVGASSTAGVGGGGGLSLNRPLLGMQNLSVDSDVSDEGGLDDDSDDGVQPFRLNLAGSSASYEP